MTEQLKTDLRTYSSYLDAHVSPIVLDEVMGVLPVPVVEVRRSRGWAVAAAAGLFVLAVFGGIAWLTQPAEVTPSADEPDVTTTVATTTIAPDAAPPPPATESAPVPATDDAPAEDLPDLLDEALASTTAIFGNGNIESVRPQLVYIDAYRDSMAESHVPPEPRFDTTALGRELLLIDVSPDELAGVPDLWGQEGEQLFLAGVRLDGTTHAAAFTVGVNYREPDGNDILWPSWALVRTSRLLFETLPGGELRFDFTMGGVGSYSSLDPDQPNLITVLGGNNFEALTPTVIGGLPPSASVVSSTRSDGTKVWQRPRSGIVIFLDPELQCQRLAQPFGNYCPSEFIVHAADGTEMLRITRVIEEATEFRISR